MPAQLKTLEFDPPAISLPRRIVELLDEADRRIERFQFDRRDEPIAAFVPSDFATVYQALVEIQRRDLAAGHRFLEWGCGVGVATCLAAELGFDAVGIEIEPELVELSQALAEDFDIEAEFVAGSFVPERYEYLFDMSGDFNWVRTDGMSVYDEIELEPDDFDLVYCYPWPGEEALAENLFAACGANGSLLMSYHGREGVRVRRRVCPHQR